MSDRIKRNVSFYKSLGDKLIYLRKSKGDSVGVISNLLGVTFQQIGKYEKGQNKISIPSLLILAKYYEVPMSFFIDMLDNYTINTDKLSLTASRYFAEIKDPKTRDMALSMLRILASKPCD